MKYLIILLVGVFSQIGFANSLNERACDTVIYVTYRDAFLKAQKEGIYPKDCWYGEAWVSKIKAKGEVFSIVAIREDLCGGSAEHEATLENDTCKVLGSKLLGSD